MKLSEHVESQGMWQINRGIDASINGKWGTDRIQVEIDEAKAEIDPLKGLEELIDVTIITFGGMYEAAKEAGIPFEELDRMLEAKLEINSLKYPESIRGMFETTEEYIQFCRDRWAANRGRE